MSKQHVLIVEDEEKIANLLKDYLEKAGYSTSCLGHGDQVLPYIKKSLPNLILLDIMLPGMDGIEICKSIRKFSNVPILMITARGEEVDRVIGLELGADDYISKPFSPREVVARVRAVLRRFNSDHVEKRLATSLIELNEETHQVIIKGEELRLTPIEFGLLKVLLAHPNRVFSRNQLINLVQGYNFEGYDRTVDTHIKNLRKKIANILPEKDIIVSVYGVGYKLDDGD